MLLRDNPLKIHTLFGLSYIMYEGCLIRGRSLVQDPPQIHLIFDCMSGSVYLEFIIYSTF